MKNVVLKRSNTLWRPKCHFTSEIGWINDPNGLVFFNGEYHLFYQFNPYSSEWGSMHWGHAVSSDMVHWKDLPIALFPNSPYDFDPVGGCFSGSAIVRGEKLFIFYTGSVQSGKKVIQTQNLVVSDDGRTFNKYELNPIINKPKGFDEPFRDPKVFQYEEIYYMILGSSLDEDGKILLYKSENLYDWEYLGILFSSNGRFGTMFECPDLFLIDEKWVLLFSPINSPDRKKCVYLTGQVDFSKVSFKIESYNELDYGFDYYAPQSFVDERGDRILIAWLNKWEWMPYFTDWGPTSSEGWRGVLSSPRKASLLGSRLCLNPIEAFSQVFNWKKEYKNVMLKTSKKTIALGTNPIMLDLSFNVSKIFSNAFKINLFECNNSKIEVYVDLFSHCCILNLDSYQKGLIVAPLNDKKNVHDLKIVVDKSCVELFIDEGWSNLSINIYPEDVETKITIDTPFHYAILDSLSIKKVTTTT